MTLQNRCRLLLRFRDEGVRLGTFMGVRWIAMKAVLLGASLAMVSMQDVAIRAFGLVILGFALGMIAAGVRSYIVGREAWMVQKEFLDWRKVEACAKGTGS